MAIEIDDTTAAELDELGFDDNDDAPPEETEEGAEEELDLDALDEETSGNDPGATPRGTSNDPEDPANGDEPAEKPTKGALPDEGRADGQPSASGTDAATETDDYEPLKYTSDGKEYEVEGAVVFEDEIPGRGRGKVIVMPLDEFERQIQPNLRDRRVVAAEMAELRQKLIDADPETSPAGQRVRALTEFFDDLAFDEAKSDEDILQAIYDLRARKPVWEAEQRAIAAEERLAARDTESGPTAEDQQALIQQVQHGIRSYVAQAVKAEPYAGVDAAKVADVLVDLGPAALYVVERDDPATGFLAGEIRLRDDVVQRYLDREAADVKRLREGWEKVGAVRAKNERALGGTRNPLPPATPVGGSPAVAPPAEEEPTDYDSWQRSVRGVKATT